MNPLKSVGGTIIAGFVLAVIIVFVTMGDHMKAGIGSDSSTISISFRCPHWARLRATKAARAVPELQNT
jgi:hypothetical protein